MHIGVTVPLTEFGADLIGLRDFIQATEDLGYAHVRLLDHVLGADPQFHPEMPELPYPHEGYLHEPLTFMSYLAGITKRLQLVTAILILPQRQTALVAKQATEVDVLSGGRLRLWIGVGWTAQPIPPEAALRRIGRFADGWFPMFSPSDAGQEAITRMRTYAREAGRDPAAIGIEGRVSLASQAPQDWLAQMQTWETLGATHLSVRTDRGAQRSPQEHIDALRQFKEV